MRESAILIQPNTETLLCDILFSSHHSFFSYTEVTIGFERPIYRTSENDTHTTEVCARVFTPPTLGRVVIVTIETEDDTATGNFLELFCMYLNY